MRNVILVIILLIFTFFVNVIFFYVSSDYRNLLQNFKKEKILTEIDTKDDEIKVANDIFAEEDENLTIITPSVENEEVFTQNKNDIIEIKEEVVLGRSYRDILKIFSSYDLKELEINTTLFDITTEYPDSYIEYYSKGLTLYFFPTRTYNEIYDIFKVLEYELPFKINPVNNFGDNSFYINLNDDINDNIIRIVISNKGIVFGLKMKKNEYNLIKEKLNILRPNQQ